MGKQTAGRHALGSSPRNLRNGMTACFLERSGPWLRCDHPRRGKHWHGAKKDSWFRHVAVEFPAKAAPANGWNPSPTKPTL